MYWAQLVVAGLFAGAVYALYGQGITLVYKATRVPNFAHGAIGTVGAFVFFKLWDGSAKRLLIPWIHFKIPFTGVSWNPNPPALPFAAALAVALVISVLLGLLVERAAMRYLVDAPTISLIVATIGIFIVITGLAIDMFNQQTETVPPLFNDHVYSVGGIRFFTTDVIVAILALVLAIGLGTFFRFTNLGIAIRATADSRETSRLLGISADRVAAFAWAAGSFLATLAAILIIARSNRQLDFVSLTILIVPGFTAAMFGGFTSLVGTFIGGLTLGVAQNLFIGVHWPTRFLSTAFGAAGAPQFVSFLVVVIVLMTRPKFIFKGVRVDEESGVGLGKARSGLAPEDQLRRVLDRRNTLLLLLEDWKIGRWLLAALCVIPLLAIPVFTVSYWSTVLGSAVFYALIVLSIVVLTGWTGQISLAALGFAGAGAFGTALLSTQFHIPFFLVMPMSGLIGIPLALLIGVPALRLRGFFLALATLAFMVACETWLFPQSFFSTHNDVARGVLRDDLSQPSFYMSLAFAALVYIGVRNLGRTRVARAWHAIRDSENTAISMGIDPVRYKLLAFAVSGFIAGVAGGSFGYLNLKIVAANFTFFFTLTYITAAVISGIAMLAAGPLAAFNFVLLPTITARSISGTNEAIFIIGGLLAVLTVIQYPNGLAYFYTRVLRRFEAGERVAWASTTDEEGVAPAAAGAGTEEEEEGLFDRAAHGDLSLPAGVPGA